MKFSCILFILFFLFPFSLNFVDVIDSEKILFPSKLINNNLLVIRKILKLILFLFILNNLNIILNIILIKKIF